MRDLYLIRRDVLDRIHQNPNAVPIVYPDKLGAILAETDLPATVHETLARLELAALDENAGSKLASIDKADLLNKIKARRDLIGFLNSWSYDEGVAGSRAAWEVLWDGMRNWDNRAWHWQEIAAGTALASLFCPAVVEHDKVVLSKGSTGH